MSVGLGPPQISPDGKWVWDGQKWLPIPPVEGAVAAPAAASIPYLAQEPQPAAEVVNAPVEISPPLWQQPASPTQLSPYRIGAAGAVGLLIIVVLLNATNIISIPWPWIAAEPTVTMIHGSPQPIVSDYVLANTFLNNALGAALSQLGLGTTAFAGPGPVRRVSTTLRISSLQSRRRPSRVRWRSWEPA